jgi:two-component system nitrate/nitrite sensor histidine kinase NarX
MVTIPLDHKGVELGVIRLFTESPGLVESPERHRLLLSVGRHLGMSIAKARTDDESKMLSIVRERAAIAYELHDSLAQTLASLRLQADMLADSLAAVGDGGVPAELARIRTTLESANVELRELIAGFRAPVDGRDLRTALEEMSARYTAQSALTVHLQIHGELPELPAGPQLQVVRIVGEALANACAHSGGNLARVLVRSESASVRVLVEDDGEGFSAPPCDAALGEHIGLSVMRERARWLGGTLAIESEPGEGTRVSLTFPRARAESPAQPHAH